MKPPFTILSAIAALVLIPATGRADECMATLKDPHGSVTVPCDRGGTAKLKADEHFLAERGLYGWSVYLKSGCNGFIGKAELQLLPNEPLMKLNYNQEKKLWQKLQSAPASDLGETGSSAKARGFNYFKILSAASNGDLKAMAKFFSLARFMDGGAAEGYYGNEWELFHVAGDEAFARFLVTQPAKVRARIGATLTSPGDTEPISKPKPYIRRYFPNSYEILFGNEQ